MMKHVILRRRPRRHDAGQLKARLGLSSHLLRDIGLSEPGRAGDFSGAINPNLKGWV